MGLKEEICVYLLGC